MGIGKAVLIWRDRENIHLIIFRIPLLRTTTRSRPGVNEMLLRAFYFKPLTYKALTVGVIYSFRHHLYIRR